jgi:hypothetical protein
MTDGGALLSVNDYADDLEASARYALGTPKAITVCQFHSDATIRLFDDDAERHAYALATTIIKSDGTMWMRGRFDGRNQASSRTIHTGTSQNSAGGLVAVQSAKAVQAARGVDRVRWAAKRMRTC